MKKWLHTCSSVLPVFGLFFLFNSCAKDSSPDPLPELKVLFSPTKAATTDWIEIQVQPVTLGKADRTLFYRWDWNSDGIWDTEFSTADKVKHRFMQPGSLMVRMEVADGKKQVKLSEVPIVIQQGYSAPKTVFSITPGKGNILTTFGFDASLTKDDEDSLSQLKFRWDFLGTGHFSAEYSLTPLATYTYATAGVYHPKLEARDPSGRSATFSIKLQVTMEDSLIRPDFTVNKSFIRMGDTLMLDASKSFHSADVRRPLLYSWLFPGRVEWTVMDAEAVKTFTIRQEGAFAIQLKVYDKASKMFNTVSKDFYAAGQNLPPVARIRAGSIFGNINSQFYFDSWASSDDSLPPSELQVRWDFDGNGFWDTPYSTDKVVYHQYESAGEYNIRLQVRDNEGLISIDTKLIHVSPNTNETGYFWDQRDNNFYGTVKIGNQWWMSRNMNYTIPPKEEQGVLQWLCLFEQSKWCDQVGKIYRVGAVVENRADDEFANVCPRGWHIPSKPEWETLFNSIGGLNHLNELRVGGTSDFNALDLGYGSYYIVWEGMSPIDTIYEFHETFQTAWFMSTTGPYDPQHVRTDIWQWEVGKNVDPWMGYGSTYLYMQVRCLKNE